MPSFQKEVTDAYGEMTSLESPNDFFISSFVVGTEQLSLFAKGRGGLPKVKELLLEHFQSEVAVVMFRITAVDDRGKVKSFRTKLIHVVYIGPSTPVMKRAKVGPWNSAFKQPFTMNLSIQTDDVDGDLSEAALERSLRASGGAHQPTYFDFTNAEGTSGSVEASVLHPSPQTSPNPPSPMNREQPRSPSGNRSYLTCWNEYSRHFHDRKAAELKRQYSEEHCKLVYTDMSAGSMRVFEGSDAISEQMESFFDEFKDEYEIVKVEKTQPDTEHVSEGIIFCYWTSEQGLVSGADTICIVGGKIVMHTLVVSRKTVPTAAAEAAADLGGGGGGDHDGAETGSQATVEFEDAALASNMAEAGDVPSQEGASEPLDIALSSQGLSEGDDFVEVDQVPFEEEAPPVPEHVHEPPPPAAAEGEDAEAQGEEEEGAPETEDVVQHSEDAPAAEGQDDDKADDEHD